MKPLAKFTLVTLLPALLALGACILLVCYLDGYERERVGAAYRDSVQVTATKLADAISSAGDEEKEVEAAITAWAAQDNRHAAAGTFKWQRGGTLSIAGNIPAEIKDQLERIKNLKEWKSPGIKSPSRGLMELATAGEEGAAHFVLWTRIRSHAKDKSAKGTDAITVRGLIYPENPVEEPERFSRAILVGLLSAVFIGVLVLGAWIYRQRAEGEERKNRQQTENFNNASHEIANEVQPITNMSFMLQIGSYKTETERLEAYKTISLQCERLTRSIGRLLDYCRLEQDLRSYKRERVDVKSVVQEMVRAESPNLAQRGLKAETRIEEGLCAFADRDAVCQILSNLLSNAAKYAPKSGAIEVGARIDGDQVELTVADRGPGIPKEKAARIFEQFYRAVDSLATEVKGLGLGLFISRGLARGMGGDLVYAPREGGGSVFTLSLPREA